MGRWKNGMSVAKKITKKKVGITGATGICEGAYIRTPFGGRRIDLLRKGDLVVTRDNGLQPVAHVWTRLVTENEIVADPSLGPVSLETRAIGPMMPQKPLRVGGALRLLIPGWRLKDEEDTVSCLVPARDVDGVSLGNDAPVADVVYYNIVFETPQVFAVNGLPVESFTLDKDTMRITPKAVKDDLRSLLPDAASDKDVDCLSKYKRRKRVTYTPDLAYAPPKPIAANTEGARPQA